MTQEEIYVSLAVGAVIVVCIAIMVHIYRQNKKHSAWPSK